MISQAAVRGDTACVRLLLEVNQNFDQGAKDDVSLQLIFQLQCCMIIWRIRIRECVSMIICACMNIM